MKAQTCQQIARICVLLARVCGYLGCAVTGYNYASMQCAVSHGGASAPTWIALLTAVPWAAAILVFLAAAWLLQRKVGTKA